MFSDIGRTSGGVEGRVEELAADEETVRLQVNRLLDDPLFNHSRRYSNLLKHIVDCSLKREFTSLKERVIGIEVFGRPADYDTSIDPTVRVTANEVRKRLALYYALPSHKDELHIDVPVGSYIAEFKRVKSLEETTSEPPVFPSVPPIAAHAPVEDREIPALVRRPFFSSRSMYLGLLGVLLLAAAGSALYFRLLTPTSALDRFWAPMTAGSEPTLICISSSPGSGTGSAASQDSSTAQSQASQKLYEFTSQRVNVSMTDVTAASGIARFLHAHGRDFVIRPAHGTNLADLQAAPAVLLGSFTNEWTVRLGSGLHFRLKKDSTDFGSRWIEDSTNPANKSWMLDMSAPNEQVANDYALVSRVFDLSTGRCWIGIAGLTGTGTLAAYQLTTNPKEMRALTAEFPKGWENKNLQFVVQVRTIQGSPGASHVVAKYIW